MKVTFNLPDDLLDTLRDAIVYMQRQTNSVTLSRLVEAAIRNHLTMILQLNARKSFPKRSVEPRPGRRIQ